MKAMLARDATVPTFRRIVLEEDWWMEPKYDGIRTLVHVDHGTVTWHNRNGVPLSKRTPEATTHLLEQVPGTFTLDGELVKGRLYVFDLPRLGRELFTMPLWRRREALEKVLDLLDLPDDSPIIPTPRALIKEGKEWMLHQALEERWEGVMLKQHEAFYDPGRRSADMLKLKFTHTIDCVVTELRSHGKENATLSLVVRHTLPDGDLMSFQKVGHCSLLGKEQVALFDVVEVRFLYASPDGHLVQPRMLRKRTDKAMEKCTIDQIEHATSSQPA